MTAFDALTQARESLSVKRAFGDPYQRNGITLIPVARIKEYVGHLPFPGGEAGSHRAVPSPFGRATAVRVSAKPLGVYVVRGDRITWQPAADVRCIACMGGAAVIVAMLVARSVRRRRATVAKAVAEPAPTDATAPTEAEGGKSAEVGEGDLPAEGAPRRGAGLAHSLGGRRPHASRRGVRWTAALVAVMVEVSAFVAWRWRLAHAQTASIQAGEPA